MHPGRYKNPLGFKYFKLKIAPYRKELLLRKKKKGVCFLSGKTKNTHFEVAHLPVFTQ